MIGTIPAAGTSSPTGTKITLVVSAGFPELAYDNGTALQIVNGANDKPAVTVPAGMSAGLPVGMMPIGRHWEDATVLRAADAFQKLT